MKKSLKKPLTLMTALISSTRDSHSSPPIRHTGHTLALTHRRGRAVAAWRRRGWACTGLMSPTLAMRTAQTASNLGRLRWLFKPSPPQAEPTQAHEGYSTVCAVVVCVCRCARALSTAGSRWLLAIHLPQPRGGAKYYRQRCQQSQRRCRRRAHLCQRRHQHLRFLRPRHLRRLRRRRLLLLLLRRRRLLRLLRFRESFQATRGRAASRRP